MTQISFPPKKHLGNLNENLIALVNRIRDLGVSSMLDLPTIVFCGKQSAGKTSLIEAMSGVSLPRSTGTCTRMPTELRLTNSSGFKLIFWFFGFLVFQEKWNCKVKIRRESGPIYEEKVTEKLFGTVHDPNKVQTIVENAQKNALKQTGSLQFSKDVICVDIRVIQFKKFKKLKIV